MVNIICGIVIEVKIIKLIMLFLKWDKWLRKNKNIKFMGKDYKWDSNEKCYPSVAYVGKNFI